MLGDHLWGLAFNNRIGDELMKAYRDVVEADEDTRVPIRVRIGFERDNSELAALPWEYVRCPDTEGIDGFPLAAESTLVLGRFLANGENQEIRVADQAVRVLVVLLLPDTPVFKEQRQEFKKMLDQLNDIGSAIEVIPIDRWDPAKVAQKIRELRAENPPSWWTSCT